jgi:glycosyltransferase involved in cell wall biosynthesis
VIATIHIWSERNAYLHFYTVLDRLILRCFDKAVGVSNEIVSLLRRAGISPEKIDKVSNGIHVEMFEGAPPTLAEEIGKKDRVLVGMVSRLLPEKGVVHYVRAAQQVLKVCPQAYFVLVGDGPEGPRLKGLARELGIEDSVLFAGRRGDMPSVYASLDIFVLPSLNEGMPLVILEAMAAKRAVIATRIAGIPEIIQHEQTGLLIEPGDIASLRDSIVRLIADRGLRDRLAASGYAHVRQCHSREVMAKNYVRLYEGLLQVHAPAKDVQPQERATLPANETGQGSR